MVAAGLGIAIAPRLALTSHRDDVRLVRFGTDTPAPVRRILLARSRTRAATPTAPVMTRLLREAAGRFADSGEPVLPSRPGPPHRPARTPPAGA